MIFGLFTTRIVLDALGEESYGIYSLVAGVVGMLAILQSSMTTASMRFMAFSLGSDDKDSVIRTFNTTLLLHILIGIIVFIVIEILGNLMLEKLLKIPNDKMFEAKVIFHFMALTTFITIVSVPYDAVINSHENLLTLSIVDIVGAILKLAIAVYLIKTSLNQLIIYGFGMFLVQIIMRVIKRRYSTKHYKECRVNFKKYFDKNLTREILLFSWWNLFGSIAAMSITQLRSVLLNMFFGVKINAAEGVASTSSNQVNNVSVSLTRAINPQLVKSEGSGDRKKMLQITYISTKFSIFLFSIIAIPVIIETPYLLSIWLKETPEYAVIFIRLTLINLFISKFTFEITNAIRAVGKIRNFQVVETLILILNLPVAYYLFKRGYTPEYIYFVSIFFTLITSLYRIYIGKKIAELDIYIFLRQSILPTFIPIIIAFTSLMTLTLFKQPAFDRLMISFLSNLFLMTVYIYTFGINDYEKKKIVSILDNIKRRFKHGK